MGFPTKAWGSVATGNKGSISSPPSSPCLCPFPSSLAGLQDQSGVGVSPVISSALWSTSALLGFYSFAFMTPLPFPMHPGHLQSSETPAWHLTP